MKISEITEDNSKKLVEPSISEGGTAFLSEDMKKIAAAHAEIAWSQEMTGDELSVLMESWAV